jgi:hypothetical protein
MTSSSVAAGASSTTTGTKVRWLMSNATCGRQKSAVANQSPSSVGGVSSRLAAGRHSQPVRQLFVPRTTSTDSVSHSQRIKRGRASSCTVPHLTGHLE